MKFGIELLSVFVYVAAGAFIGTMAADSARSRNDKAENEKIKAEILDIIKKAKVTGPEEEATKAQVIADLTNKATA